MQMTGGFTHLEDVFIKVFLIFSAAEHSSNIQEVGKL
jgi:hypothetical protein